jgi:hypothetical protein
VDLGEGEGAPPLCAGHTVDESGRIDSTFGGHVDHMTRPALTKD